MNSRKTGDKGFKTEETVRNYFLRAGFFVVRSVLLKNGDDELTDIDLWIYERSATLARRRTIIDIKDKARPQAAERLFFVKGLAELLQVDSAGVATTDNRKSLRDLARRHGLLWLDGIDLQRMKNSPELNNNDRLSDEEIEDICRGVDTARGGDAFRRAFVGIKSTVGDKFGPLCANSCLSFAQSLAQESVRSHPQSPSAVLSGRLTYLAAAIAAVALDFYSAEAVLRPMNERIAHLVDALRYGDDPEGTRQRLNWAEAAVRDYAPNGPAIARVIKDKFRQDLAEIPAEGLAHVVANATRNDMLFNVAKILEDAAYARFVPTFDDLPTSAKAYLGAVLDFGGVDRAAFAVGWKAEPVKAEPVVALVDAKEQPDGQLTGGAPVDEGEPERRAEEAGDIGSAPTVKDDRKLL